MQLTIRFLIILIITTKEILKQLHLKNPRKNRSCSMSKKCNQWSPASIFSNIFLDKNFVPDNYIIIYTYIY